MATWKELLAREKHVVVHGQSIRFRLIKYAVLIPILLVLYMSEGPLTTFRVLMAFLAAALIVHFFFRYMSDGWTKSWWLYEKK